MADENQSDEAAIAAAGNFWDENPGLEEAAANEVPDSAPSTSGRLNALRQDHADQQSALEQEGEIDPGAADGIPTEEEPQKKPESKTPVTKPVTKTAAVEETAGPELDPVLRSIAEESGWTAEKIDRLYAADPELATETFERLADSYANLSRQFLASPGTTPAPVTQHQPAQVQGQSTTAPQLPAFLTDEALQKFAEAEGETAATLLKGMRDHFVAQNTALEARVQNFEAAAKQAENRAIATEALTAVKSLREKFASVYGASDDARTLTVGQQQKLTELYSLADQIRAGAVAQGRSISVSDAIKRAHYIVSRDSVKTEARQEISATIRKRAKNATARPTQRTNPRAAGQTRSDEAAVNVAAEKMAELGFGEG